ncbi:hypothetical protein B566_EDAN008377 [Ephemera danica]|nr:hypothetical protein B566_EDAN008377 [Ephemera danica]
MPAAQEDAVTRALGPFGLWQARGCLLVALVKIPAAWQMLTIIFSAPQPFTVGGSFWCARPSDHWSVQRWINLSHPKIIKVCH